MDIFANELFLFCLVFYALESPYFHINLDQSVDVYSTNLRPHPPILKLHTYLYPAEPPNTHQLTLEAAAAISSIAGRKKKIMTL